MNQNRDDVAIIPADAQKTASGIAYRILRPNPEGQTVSASDWVKLHYTGWTADGKRFDTSLGGEPAIFPVDSLIPGMTEAIRLGRVGESLRAWVPEELAYQGIPGMPAGMLVFEFDILAIVTPSVPPLDPDDGAVALREGIAMSTIRRGECTDPIGLRDTVEIDAIVWSRETGERLVSTIEKGEPLRAQLKSLCSGLRVAVQHAHKGDKILVWCTQEMGIDPSGADIPGGLVFEVDVLDVFRGVDAVDAPEDVACPPEDGEKTPRGVVRKILRAGTGTMHPSPRSTVRVHYTGWTTDGEMFDSSVARGTPATFSLAQVIPGWTEAVTMMVEGEVSRFWIPEYLAYQGVRGAPQGMLVFDIELIAIV